MSLILLILIHCLSFFYDFDLWVTDLNGICLLGDFCFEWLVYLFSLFIYFFR